MTATVEAERPDGLYMLRLPFDGTFDQEAGWYERMGSDRAMSLRLNGNTMAGRLVTCWPFPLEKCVRVAFRPDERQQADLTKATPVEKAQSARTVHALVEGAWYSFDLPNESRQKPSFDEALHRALHGDFA